MKNTLAILLSDGYKQVHAEQYPQGLTKLVSYLTPRKSRLNLFDKMAFFGLQAFNKTFLIDYFNENFFSLPVEDVISESTKVLDVMLGKNNYKLDKIISLHKLGYLPLKISALPEGSLIPMKVPCIEITNTHPDFAWVVQWVESLLSAEIWKSCVHATVGHSYRQITNKYYDLTVDDNVPRNRAMSDFGFRGMSCLQEATKTSASWLLSFASTATIPAVPYLEKMYNCDSTKEPVGYSAISTEHSVMASNFSVDGDEISFVRRLLTEIYPNASFSMVSDTYDHWNIIDNILPQLKKEILEHNGKLLIRPDSGDIVEISVNSVKHLWNTFKGTINSKGYKVLDPHIGLIYGDGVTLEYAETIYKRLMEEGYASNNIIFGVGSFSFNAIMEDGLLKPFTRDTFSVAVKATYGVVNGKSIMIYKNPKTDTDSFKKSQKGMIHVYRDENGEITYKDGYYDGMIETRDVKLSDINMLETVFEDGRLVKEQSLSEIRDRLHNDNGGF